MLNQKYIGDVVETLINLKDQFYSDLSLDQKASLDDACNLLSKNFGDHARYAWDCSIIGKKIVSVTPDDNSH